MRSASARIRSVCQRLARSRWRCARSSLLRSTASVRMVVETPRPRRRASAVKSCFCSLVTATLTGGSLPAARAPRRIVAAPDDIVNFTTYSRATSGPPRRATLLTIPVRSSRRSSPDVSTPLTPEAAQIFHSGWHPDPELERLGYKGRYRGCSANRHGSILARGEGVSGAATRWTRRQVLHGLRRLSDLTGPAVSRMPPEARASRTRLAHATAGQSCGVLAADGGEVVEQRGTRQLLDHARHARTQLSLSTVGGRPPLRVPEVSAFTEMTHAPVTDMTHPASSGPV